jgi:hypothetical protein
MDAVASRGVRGIQPKPAVEGEQQQQQTKRTDDRRRQHAVGGGEASGGGGRPMTNDYLVALCLFLFFIGENL